MRKIYLNIPWAMRNFAATKGAQREQKTGTWFFSGELPTELLEFVIEPIRTREPDQAPTCPVCGSVMCKRYNGADKSPFWGCPAYPRCKGRKRWEYGSATPLIDLAEKALSPSGNTPSSRQPKLTKKDNAAALKIRITRIISMAASLFGEQSLEGWLHTPSGDLKGKTPFQLLATIDDCIQVEKILRQLQAERLK